MTTFFYFTNYNSIIVQVRCFAIETIEVGHIGYNGFLFLHLYSCEVNSNGQQFHQNQQSEQTPLNSLNTKKHGIWGLKSWL
jgi:hypothetical protein